MYNIYFTQGKKENRNDKLQLINKDHYFFLHCNIIVINNCTVCIVISIVPLLSLDTIICLLNENKFNSVQQMLPLYKYLTI